jgi:short-subunit dehydrogenase
MEFRERVVVVTGASSGIGRATALAFARAGATVVAVARRESRLRDLVDECRAFVPASTHLAGDLGERAFAERVVDETVARHGRVDVLVNNAAMPLRKVVYRISVEEAETALRTNFLSCLWTTWAAIPAMLRQGGGAIVNVSSFASKVVPTHETIYVATKGALNAFSEGLWNDLHGSGIHVALVHPGPIDTEIWAKGQHRSGYRGRRHPPALVADAILAAVRERRHEVTVPRASPPLVAARWLRLLWPRALRAGVRRMDPVPALEIEAARERARRGLRLGEVRAEEGAQ